MSSGCTNISRVKLFLAVTSNYRPSDVCCAPLLATRDRGGIEALILRLPYCQLPPAYLRRCVLLPLLLSCFARPCDCLPCHQGFCCLQGLFVAFLVGGGAIDTVQDGKNLQNFLICCEMLPAALGMLFAFPYTEYKSAPGAGSGQYLMGIRGSGYLSLRAAASIREARRAIVL